ncbi:hypothetical protein BDB00DRAFT_797199 [Zychaea mexicana]|uniref:uncharacterized protein n=1 Tax=Zychaea mexicana TaxID=64656 RepID=UPI0022FEA406|nr:uncharacterized protein BDB00DRAFT_797199 [Zychaea mexicana]KAI9498902.1 hypothetical protein BDB00DRAFT_797199 [Zychaea mexicana]
MDLPNPSKKPRTPNRNHPPLASLENKNESLRSEQSLQKRPFTPLTSAATAAIVERKQLTGAPTVHSAAQALPAVHDENASPFTTTSPTATHATKKRDLFIPQTYKATKNRVERTCLRPTAGGKTVAAMKHLHNDKRPGNNNHHHTIGASGNNSGISSNNHQIHDRNDTPHQRLSAEQLKLLSRRIDPSAPLQSPHSSPVKPALPSSFVTSYSPSSQPLSSIVPAQPQQQQSSQFQNRTTTDTTIGANTTDSSSNNNNNNNNSNNISNDTNTGSNHSGSSSSAPSSSTLYQTCMAIWANSPPSLADLRHDNIKYLSELLKIRLCQAKARALASLGPQDPNALLLSKATKKHRVRLARKRHQAAPLNTRTVSGNGQRLRRQQQHMYNHRELISSNNALSLQVEDDRQSQSLKIPKKRGSTAGGAGKKRNVGESKARKTTTTSKQTRRSRATPPLILEDGKLPTSICRGVQLFIYLGKKRPYQSAEKLELTYTPWIDLVFVALGSRAFVCKSCGKKYKNRNGLAYHRDRCKQKGLEDENQQQYELAEDDNDEEEQQSGEGIKCVCKKPTEDRGTMIQCDKCQMWQHLKCVGVDQKDIAKDYTCPYCVKKEAKVNSNSKATTAAKARRHSELDEMEEEEDELAEDDEEMGEEQQQQDLSLSTPAISSATISSRNDTVMKDGDMDVEEQLVTLNDDDLSGTESNEDEFMNADIHDEAIHGVTPENNIVLFDMKSGDREQQPVVPLENNSASQLAPEWDDLLFSQTPDNSLRQATQEPWTKMSSSSHDENKFANWDFSDLSLLQPPSLLFSDAMVDDDSSNLQPSSDFLPTDHPSSDLGLPTSPEPLWFQFANFEDDYQCEEAQ